MLRLYGVPVSRAFRCIWMLEELGLEYEIVPIRFGTADTQSPEYLDINPNGKVPTLVDGDTVVWESLAINHYLADRDPAPDRASALWPRSLEARALAYRWSFWSMGEFEGPIDAARRLGSSPPDTRLTGSQPDRRLAGSLPDGWAKAPMDVLESALVREPWLAGHAFGLADLNVAVMFQRPDLASVSRAKYPSIEAWLRRCQARDAFERMAKRAAAAES